MIYKNFDKITKASMKMSDWGILIILLLVLLAAPTLILQYVLSLFSIKVPFLGAFAIMVLIGLINPKK